MLADDYNCRNSSTCTMTSGEMGDLRQRETDIEKNCNSGRYSFAYTPTDFSGCYAIDSSWQIRHHKTA